METIVSAVERLKYKISGHEITAEEAAALLDLTGLVQAKVRRMMMRVEAMEGKAGGE